MKAHAFSVLSFGSLKAAPKRPRRYPLVRTRLGREYNGEDSNKGFVIGSHTDTPRIVSYGAPSRGVMPTT